MSSPPLASRASERTHRVVLRVSQLWPAHSCVRSRSKQCASTAWHKTCDRRPSPGPRDPASRVGDDLASLIAQICLTNYVERRELQLTAFSRPGLARRHNERNHR